MERRSLGKIPTLPWHRVNARNTRSAGEFAVAWEESAEDSSPHYSLAFCCEAVNRSSAASNVLANFTNKSRSQRTVLFHSLQLTTSRDELRR